MIIREAQLDALAAAHREKFIERIIESLSRLMPAQCQGLNADELRGFVEHGIDHAFAYGVTSEHDVAAFLMLACVTSKDMRSPDAPTWATNSFQDSSKTPGERVEGMLRSVLGVK